MIIDLKRAREEKVERILEAAVAVLAEKGYENATIKQIALKAKVNWGLLHYYFKDKEDLVVHALEFASDKILASTSQLFSAERSPEETVDRTIDLLKKNYSENAGFYKLLFEMWCASGRSKKIKTALVECMNRVVAALQIELDKSLSTGIDGSKRPHYSRGLASLILAMSDGMAFQMILETDKIHDENIWQLFRSSVLGLLRK